MADTNLRILINAQDKTKPAFASVNSSINSVSASIKNLALSFGVSFSIAALVNKLTQVERTTGNLKAGLVTATGSMENANKAFVALTSLATYLPETLDDTTRAFTRLVNLGLTPSAEAIKAYANIAAATPGKSIIDFVESVADAIVGEFIRLREFGIKAQVNGKMIDFTFRGVKTSVQNNAAAIEQYLINLGKIEFMGAIENRMKTLDGAMSNFGDAWDGLFRTINKAGTGDVIKNGFVTARKAVEDLTNYIGGGTLQAEIDTLGVYFSDFGEGGSTAFEMVAKGYNLLSLEITGSPINISLAKTVTLLRKTYGVELPTLLADAAANVKFFVAQNKDANTELSLWLKRSLGMISQQEFTDRMNKAVGDLMTAEKTWQSQLAKNESLFQDSIKAENELAAEREKQVAAIKKEAAANMAAYQQTKNQDLGILASFKTKVAAHGAAESVMTQATAKGASDRTQITLQEQAAIVAAEQAKRIAIRNLEKETQEQAALEASGIQTSVSSGITLGFQNADQAATQASQSITQNLKSIDAAAEKPKNVQVTADSAPVANLKTQIDAIPAETVKTIIIRTVNESGNPAFTDVATQEFLAANRIPGHASGITLPGFGGGDRHPALLESGEAVVNKYLVRNVQRMTGVFDFQAAIARLMMTNATPRTSASNTVGQNIYLQIPGVGNVGPMLAEPNVVNELSKALHTAVLQRGRRP